MGRVVMVTGVSRHLGSRVAARLCSEPDVERVIGVDVIPPPTSSGDAEFVRADIRNPVIARVIDTAGVDTVLHMAVIATPLSAGGRASMKEINVIGTMQLLAACQKAPSVRKLVVKSSATVYGSSQRDPAMFTEDMEPRALPRGGFAKDSVEVEGYVRGFSRRRPDVTVTLLRLANTVGPGMDTPFTSWFTLPAVPGVMGFDPRFQLIHEDDTVEVLTHATLEEHAGTFNVAGDGMLTLSQAARRAGRPVLRVPPPLAGPWGRVVRRLGIADLSADQVRFLTYGRGLDTIRMRQVLGFTPRWSTRDAFDDFARSHALVPIIDPLTRLAGAQGLGLDG